MILPPDYVHPTSEGIESEEAEFPDGVEVDTYAGKVHVEWDPSAAVTPLGQLSFFIEFF